MQSRRLGLRLSELPAQIPMLLPQLLQLGTAVLLFLGALLGCLFELSAAQLDLGELRGELLDSPREGLGLSPEEDGEQDANEGDERKGGVHGRMGSGGKFPRVAADGRWS